MNKDFIQIEDFNITQDMDFLQSTFIPYLKDIFSDLLIRCPNPRLNERFLDKAIFIEYCNLPGIIGERLFISIATNGKSEYITESQFINALVLIFNSELENRINLTFEMYDFNADGQVTKEDIRLILSYIPFKRNQNLLIKQKKSSSIYARRNIHLSRSIRDHTQQDEGLYKKSDGKDLKYQDRKDDQLEIQNLLNKAFENKSSLSFQEYKKFNFETSSEMFLSLMGVFHDRIPCASNFFRLKQIYQNKKQGLRISCKSTNSSLTRTIASPTILKNLQVITNSPKLSSQNENSPINFIIKKKNFKKYESEKIQPFELDNDSPKPTHSNHIVIEELKSQNNVDDNDFFNYQNPIAKGRDGDSSDYSNNEKRFLSINTNGSNQKFMNRRNDRTKLKDSSPSSSSSKHYQENSSAQIPSQLSSSFLAPIKSGNNSPKNQLSPNLSKSPQIKSTFSRQFKESSRRDSVNRVNDDQFQFKPVNEEEKELEANIYSNFGNHDEKEEVFQQGDVYFQTKGGKYIKYIGIILKNDFYCYSSKDKTHHKIMHSLKSSFIKKLPATKDETKDRMLYPIKFIIPPTKYRVFYFLDEQEQTKWYNMFKQSIGQENIEDYYKLDKVLGQGSFGTVCIGFHLKTGKKVAVKIIKKKSMDQNEILQQRKEIEVLKICQHPNIVQLLDLFENHKAYYIVLEYMQGGDLYDYLKTKKMKLSEKKVKLIIKQIAQALRYLHSYGIIHRDLKLENIMMSDESDQAIPKLVDFGLAKILGPQETSDEPYGTLGYIAPEVLLSKSYSFSCDIWSLGCIAAVMLTGQLPFDHAKSKLVVEKTCFEELKLDGVHWELVSTRAKDFIAKSLTKDPAKRLTLDKVLDHDWIKPYINQ